LGSNRLAAMESGSIELKHADLTETIIGVFYDVYNELGYGFLESVYEAAMAVALREAGLSAMRQVAVPVWFRGNTVGDFRADILVEDQSVEIRWNRWRV
jgi:GxxExxY protein